MPPHKVFVPAPQGHINIESESIKVPEPLTQSEAIKPPMMQRIMPFIMIGMVGGMLLLMFSSGNGFSPFMLMMPMMMVMGMMQMLDAEQRSQMRELMQEHRPAQFERKGRLMNLRDDLMAEMHGERPDPEQVQELHGRMAELHGEMMAEMVRMRNAMHDLMTDEQREQLRQAAPADVDPEDHDAHH